MRRCRQKAGAVITMMMVPARNFILCLIICRFCGINISVVVSLHGQRITQYRMIVSGCLRSRMLYGVYNL